MNNDLLFVYGTLRQGEKKHGLIAEHCAYLGMASAKGQLFDLGPYPGMIVDEMSDTAVIGELYRITTSDGLARLDEYESCSDIFPEPHEFVRVPMAVQFEDNVIQAWGYRYNWSLEQATPIVSNDYKDR